jgi:uncharacterized protein (TIGR03435 family)
MRRKAMSVASVIAVLSVVHASGQTPASQPPQAFQIVSIKPNRTGDDTSMKTSPGRFKAVSVTPHELLLYAFRARDSQLIGGPDWLTKDKFDVEAVTGSSDDLDRTALQPLLQSVFADRFKLKFHHEMRDAPVYSLVIAKGGPRLTAHSGEGEPSAGVRANSGKYIVNARKTTMKSLADLLGRQTDRFVIDNTGLAGEYDFRLVWTELAAADSNDLSLFTAIQEQLGLKLEPAKAPVQVTVIDSVERPSEN